MFNWLRKATIVTNTILIMLFLLILSGCAGLQGGSAQQNPDTLKNGMRTAEVKNGDIGATISGSGLFVPAKLTSLFFNNLSGPLKKLHVKTSDKIKAGNPVAEIDSQTINQQIADKEMTMQLWKIRQLQNAENIVVSSRNLKLAQMNLDQANLRYLENPSEENSNELAKQQILYDQAVSADKNTNWNKDIVDIQSKLDENSLNELKNKLADCVLIAPVDGIVTFVENLSETEMVNSGRVIARIAEPKNIVLQMLTSDSRFIQNVKNGVITIGSEKYDVELYTPQAGDLLNQASANQNTNNRIYLQFGDRMPEFDLDTPVSAKLEIKKSNVLIVPKTALRDLNGKTVVDVMKGNLVDTVDVVRGLEQDGNVEIISGLEAGQTVVLY